MKTAVLVIAVLSVACAGHEVRVSARQWLLPAPDDRELTAYELVTTHPAAATRALLFYVQGSGYGTVLERASQLASALTVGIRVFLLEKPGVSRDGRLDEGRADARSGFDARVADHLVLFDAVVDAAPGLPVMLVGGSEGGAVAAEMAARRPAVTHLVLISSGGGWSQEEEFRHLLADGHVVAGLRSEKELDERVALIQAAPESLERWAGHPYRRWSSFLFVAVDPARLREGLPVLLVHGTADMSVPVGSARALRTAFYEAGRHTLTYLELPDADHALRDPSGTSLFPLVEVELAHWLAATGLLTEKEAERAVTRVRRAHPHVVTQEE